MNMSRMLLVPAAAVLLASLPLTAKKGPGEPPQHSGQVSHPNATKRHKGMDTNRDGVITRDEWRGNNRSFGNQDRNRDGVITSQDREVKPGHSKPKKKSK